MRFCDPMESMSKYGGRKFLDLTRLGVRCISLACQRGLCARTPCAHINKSQCQCAVTLEGSIIRVYARSDYRAVAFQERVGFLRWPSWWMTVSSSPCSRRLVQPRSNSVYNTKRDTAHCEERYVFGTMCAVHVSKYVPEWKVV